MESKRETELQKIATKVRIGIIEGVFAGKSGHPGGSLSISDILTYLYFEYMNIDPKDPEKEDRDRLVLSKGHAAPALYSALANKGYFDVSLLKTLRHPDSVLQGHPDMKHIPGVDMSSGSLGQGISCATGMALSSKHFGTGFKVFTILGDGECEEGQVWEAAMFAANKKLDNLIAFIDCNHLQIDGNCEDVNSPYPIDEKFKAFGWNVLEIDGNSFEEIEKALKATEIKNGKPYAIMAKTVKGKGVSYMENNVGWHGKAPNEEEYKIAIEELTNRLNSLE